MSSNAPCIQITYTRAVYMAPCRMHKPFCTPFGGQHFLELSDMHQNCLEKLVCMQIPVLNSNY